MNAYEMMKKFYELDEEILKLSNELQKTSNPSERQRISSLMDRKLAECLELKHNMERVRV